MIFFSVLLCATLWRLLLYLADLQQFMMSVERAGGGEQVGGRFSGLSNRLHVKIQPADAIDLKFLKASYWWC